jgi:hypothetical protein
MKLITGSEESINNSLSLQFIFGAKLSAYPRLDRWDEENKRLQSIDSKGNLVNAYTYHWQRARLQGDSYVALHIEDYGFRPEPMQELYPEALFDEYSKYLSSFVKAFQEAYPEGFTQEIPAPMSEELESMLSEEQLADFYEEYSTGVPHTFLDLYGDLSSTQYVTQYIIDPDENVETIAVP